MRNYLSRGKRIDNGEWAEGSLVTLPDMAFIKPKNTGVTFGPAFNQENGSYYCELAKVDPETVGQFTGDKELSNDAEGRTATGKDIFDGDIIEVVSEEDGNGIYLVFWNDEKSGWGWKHLSGSKPSEDYIDAIRIIGNRWDNPELLEATK